jgi:small-conductance mechanosensitive channel
MPRAISWLRTIILLCITFATVASLRIFSTYGEYFTYANRHLGFFVTSVLIGLLIPFIAYAYIHCWLLGNKPEGWKKNIPSPSSIKESLLSFAVLIFGLVITFFVVIVPFVAPYMTRSDSERLAAVASVIWLVITLYMFHGYDIISKGLSNKSVDKAKTKPVEKKANSVNRDLVNLKNQIGSYHKEPPKK